MNYKQKPLVIEPKAKRDGNEKRQQQQKSLDKKNTSRVYKSDSILEGDIAMLFLCCSIFSGRFSSSGELYLARKDVWTRADIRT